MQGKLTEKFYMGRCSSCQFWIDSKALEHVRIDAHQAEFDQHRRECWAENPGSVPADRRVETGPFDLCRHWQLRRPV